MRSMGEERAYMTCAVAASAVEVAHNTYELAIEKPPHFTFTPGQSMKFSFPDVLKEDGSVRHPSFTIVSAPHEPNLRFVFRGSDSPLKMHLRTLRAGDRVVMRDVLRETIDRAVYPSTPDTPLVMFACGVGIAPFLSMTSHAAHTGDTRIFRCVYANPTEKDVVYKKDIDALVQNPNLSVSCTYFLTREHAAGYAFGYFSEAVIADALTGLHEPLIHVVGPPRMVAHVEALLGDVFHIPEVLVRTKRYTGYEGEADTMPE